MPLAPALQRITVVSRVNSPTRPLEPLELVGLDLERQVGEQLEGAHRRRASRRAVLAGHPLRPALLQTVSSISASVTRKIIVAITLICGGVATRAAPQTNSGNVTVEPELKFVITKSSIDRANASSAAASTPGRDQRQRHRA